MCYLRNLERITSKDGFPFYPSSHLSAALVLEDRPTIVTIVQTLVAGAWTEREKMYHGGSFLKLADDDMDIQNPEAQNRELGGF